MLLQPSEKDRITMYWDHVPLLLHCCVRILKQCLVPVVRSATNLQNCSADRYEACRKPCSQSIESGNVMKTNISNELQAQYETNEYDTQCQLFYCNRHFLDLNRRRYCEMLHLIHVISRRQLLEYVSAINEITLKIVHGINPWFEQIESWLSFGDLT